MESYALNFTHLGMLSPFVSDWPSHAAARNRDIRFNFGADQRADKRRLRSLTVVAAYTLNYQPIKSEQRASVAVQ